MGEQLVIISIKILSIINTWTIKRLEIGWGSCGCPIFTRHVYPFRLFVTYCLWILCPYATRSNEMKKFIVVALLAFAGMAFADNKADLTDDSAFPSEVAIHEYSHLDEYGHVIEDQEMVSFLQSDEAKNMEESDSGTQIISGGPCKGEVGSVMERVTRCWILG